MKNKYANEHASTQAQCKSNNIDACIQFVFAQMAQCCGEVSAYHGCIFYSERRLLVGLAIAAFTACILTVANAIPNTMNDAVANNVQPISIRYG